MSAPQREAVPILPRELTDGLTDEVRNAPPPPTPTLPEPYAMRLVDPDADADMIAEWMGMPHLVEGWESAWPLSRWRQYLRAQLDDDYSRPLIGSLHGQAAAISRCTARQRIPSQPGIKPMHTTSGYTRRSLI